MIDTGVFIRWEKLERNIDFSRWSIHGEPSISVVTASELLVGVHRADTDDRRNKRLQFVNGILNSLAVVEIDLATARVHSEQRAKLASQGTMIGPHDLWIAATALKHGLAILTTNVSEFERVEGLQVIEFSAED